MPKVSFRMASASRDSVFGVQTNTGAETVRPYRGPVDHRAKRMLRTEGMPHRSAGRDLTSHRSASRTGSELVVGMGARLTEHQDLAVERAGLQVLAVVSAAWWCS